MNRSDIPRAKTAMFRALGTMNTITIESAPDSRLADEALRLCELRVTSLNNSLSAYLPDSEISLLNAAAGGKPVSIGKDTMLLLRESKRFSRLSDGAFSISTRPLSALWELNAHCGSVPTRGEIEQTLLLVDDADIVLDEENQTAQLLRFGQAVDLGGIAKGYAADEVCRILHECGVTSALINLGGTVVSLGREHNVGIQHPDRCTGIAMGRVTLGNACAVTSGDYERYYEVDGVRYHHIVDPKTGYPSRAALRSVTLIGKSAMELDALSTAVFVLGDKEGLPLIRQIGAEAIFVTDQMDVFCTEGLRGDFALIATLKEAL